MTNTILTQTSEILEKAIREVFETMIFMTMETLEEPGGPVETKEGRVIASLGFTGCYSGVLVCSSTMEASKVVTANMLGMEPNEIEDDSEVFDAIGEIANMIAGNVKNHFVDCGMKMDLAVPSVSLGSHIEASSKGNEGKIVAHCLSFKLEGQYGFNVEMNFQEDNSK